MNKIRIAFVGCVEEGRECLQEILDIGGNVVAIFTFTEEMSRKMSGAVSFDELAHKHQIPLHKVSSTNKPEAVELFREVNPDLIFVIGWTRLVSEDILNIPKYGVIGMHASLLPRFRGRAPVNWAIIKNEAKSGNSTMLLDAGVDTGRVVDQEAFPIRFSDTCQTVYHKVSRAGRTMAARIVETLERGEDLQTVEQNEAEATEMPKRRPEDGIIDWGKNALDLFNWVRALTHPYPGAFTYLDGRKLHVWEARIAHFSSIPIREFENLKSIEPGTIQFVNDGIGVLTGSGELLTLHQLNYENESPMDWRTFVEKYSPAVGQKFTSILPVEA